MSSSDFEDRARRAGADVRRHADDSVADVPAFALVRRRKQRRRAAITGSVAVLLLTVGIASSAGRDERESIQVVTDPPAETTAPPVERDESEVTSAPSSIVAPSTTAGPAATSTTDTTAEPTTTTIAPAPATTPTTTTAPPETNLSRNGPQRPWMWMQPRDDPNNDHDQRLWLEGFDDDGWVIEMTIDWRDGSPIETYRRSLDGCGPWENEDQDDPYPYSGGNGRFRQAVAHVYPEGQVSFEYVMSVTSVSCAGDESQVETTTSFGGVYPPPSAQAPPSSAEDAP